jgi:hypothetical protein
MKTLKDYVRTFAHPEGSIAEGYQMDNTLGFCTEYMHQYRGTTHRVWDVEEDAIMNDEILRCNSQQKRRMSDEFRNYAHAFVLDNASSLECCRQSVVLKPSPPHASPMYVIASCNIPVPCQLGQTDTSEGVLEKVSQ